MNEATPPPKRLTPNIVDQLHSIFKDRISTSSSLREQHGAQEGYRSTRWPEAVVYPLNNEEVVDLVRICRSHRIPITPFGAGTSLEGQLDSQHGGISLDLSRMDQVLSVNAEDFDCRVQAGVTREALNSYLRDTGLFFPLDPGANATIGGMAATRASGTNAVRYGTMREVVLGLTVVTPNGELIRTGGRARKSSAGFDLTRLYVGSEGTLGIITEVQIRLFGQPEMIVAASCQFPDLESAARVVIEAMQYSIPLARIEIMDRAQIEASIRYSGLKDLDLLPTLFFEFHGAPTSVAEQTKQMEAICAEKSGSAFRWSNSQKEREHLWKARHQAYYAALALKPNSEVHATDACVPISRLADVINEAHSLVSASMLDCPIVGHVGDGNFHVCIVHDKNDPAERAEAERLGTAIARLAIKAEGTCTGEHGIGRHKLALLEEEHGNSVEIMRQLKKCLDPSNLFNPGCTIPMHDTDFSVEHER